jgi:hypothetical protein
VISTFREARRGDWSHGSVVWLVVPTVVLFAAGLFFTFVVRVRGLSDVLIAFSFLGWVSLVRFAVARPWRALDRILDADYARLIHVGVSSSVHNLQGYESILEDVVAHWSANVAEPWWQAMRVRAARDGLRIDCFVGGDSTLASMGISRKIAAAFLLGPGGELYSRGWKPSDEAREALERDWGETLVVARRRHHPVGLWEG